MKSKYIPWRDRVPEPDAPVVRPADAKPKEVSRDARPTDTEPKAKDGPDLPRGFTRRWFLPQSMIMSPAALSLSPAGLAGFGLSIWDLLEDYKRAQVLDPVFWSDALKTPSKPCGPPSIEDPRDLDGVTVNVASLQFKRARPTVAPDTYVVPALDASNRVWVRVPEGEGERMVVRPPGARTSHRVTRIKRAGRFDPKGKSMARAVDAAGKPLPAVVAPAGALPEPVPAKDGLGREVVVSQERDEPSPDLDDKVVEQVVVIPALRAFFEVFPWNDDGVWGPGLNARTLYRRFQAASAEWERTQIARGYYERAVYRYGPEHHPAFVEVLPSIMAATLAERTEARVTSGKTRPDAGAALNKMQRAVADRQTKPRRGESWNPQLHEDLFAACECLRRYSYQKERATDIVKRALAGVPVNRIGKRARRTGVVDLVYGKKPDSPGARGRWIKLMVQAVPPGYRSRAQVWDSLVQPIRLLAALIELYRRHPGARGDALVQAWRDSVAAREAGLRADTCRDTLIEAVRALASTSPPH